MERLAHVLWIGGPPGSGKSTIASWLAHRHDLRVYHSDAHTWDHHDRAIGAGLPAALGWDAMAPDERWLESTPDEMAALSLTANAERCRMMLQDLCALPAAPLIVAEGTPPLPSSIAPHLESREHAVWLLPTAEFERAWLQTRPMTTFDETSDPERALENRIQRELRVGAEIERQARKRGFRVVRVDETRDLETMKRVVEELFAKVLATGPRAKRPEELRAVRRHENETVFRQLREYVARVPAAGSPETFVFPFSCECGRSGCSDRVELTVAAFEALLNSGRFAGGAARIPPKS